MRACCVEGCENDATVGIRTQRPTRANLWTKVWWEIEEAPKAASAYCGEHAAECLADLARVLA